MKRLLVTLSGVLMASPSAYSTVLLNEVHLNPPNGEDLGDRNFEFIELRSTTNASESTNGITVLIVNNDRWDFKTDANNNEVATKLNLGEVTETWSLEDMKTGSNGLLLLGDKYTELPKGGPWSGFIDPATEVGDPLGMGDGNIKSNDGLTILLVSGFTNPAPNGGTVQDPVVDFDVDDNGVLDWTQDPKPAGALQVQPWTTLLDQIGTRDRNTTTWTPAPAPPGTTGIAEPYVPTTANLTAAFIAAPAWSIGNRDPDSFARNAGLLTPSNANSWYAGKFPDPITGTDPVNSIAYRTDRVFGLANGMATPGRANLSSAPPAADFRINEVNLDPSNNRFQYIEIVNTNSPLGSRSLTGYWLVLVDSNVTTADQAPGVTNKVGTIVEEWDLSAMATGTNGYLLIADDAASSFTNFEDYVPAETGKGDPVGSTSNPKSSGFGGGDLGAKSGFTLFLIRGYKSGSDSSLPESRDIDGDDNGLVDSATWYAPTNAANTAIIDSIGFDMAAPLAGGAGKTYASVNLRTVFPEFTATDGNKACDNFSRKVVSGVPVTTNVTGSWYGGEYPSGAGFNLGFQPPLSDQITANNPTGTTHFGTTASGVLFRGAATPGRMNLSASINSASPPIPAEIRISEVMFDATDTADVGNNHDQDLNRDYVELLSTNRALAYLDGYWIIIVDNAGNNKGVFKTGAPLDGQTTGLNGLLLLGDNYDTTISIPYIGVEGLLPPSTAAVDPVVAFGGDDIPGKGATIMLIRGPAFDLATTPSGPFKVGGPITLGANLKPAGDIDPDNDGVLLPSSDWLAPGSVLVDAISIGAVNPGPEYGYINGSAWLPDCAARFPTDFRASTPGAWYYGEVDQTANPIVPATDFTSNFFPSSFHGHASPGRWNHGAPVGPVTPGSVLINEVHFNPAGGDGNFEFIELLDRAGAQRSLNGYTLLMLDNVKTNTGTVQRVWNLDGTVTGTNGLAVITNGTRVTSPWSASFRTETAVTDLPGRDDLLTGFGDSTIATESDNQSVMLILVRNFNSFLGADLDASTGAPAVDSPGDGIFDNAGAAWEAGIIHDSVILRSWTIEPPAVQAAWNGFTYTPADLSGAFFANPNALFYHPETVSRFRGNLTANSGSAWYGGDLVGGTSGKSGTDPTYVSTDNTHPPLPANFLGRVTPGQVNLAANESTDPDGDGVVTLLEEAFGSNPFAQDAISPLPGVSTVDIGGTKYAAISFNRIKGGTITNNVYAAEAYTYTVQNSTNLETWSNSGTTLVPTPPPVSNPDGITENVTFRLNVPLTDPAGKSFLRVRVGRQ